MRLKRMLCMCTCIALFVSAIAAHTAFAGGDNSTMANMPLMDTIVSFEKRVHS